MDNFVSKPFRAEELFQAVEGVAATVPAEPETEAVAATSAPGAAADDVPTLDWSGALRNLEGDEEFLCELAEMFLQQYPGMLEAVEEAISNGSGDELKRAAHALKGSSQVVGGKAVSAAALQLEVLGREENLAEAGPVLQHLSSRLATLEAELSAAVPERAT